MKLPQFFKKWGRNKSNQAQPVAQGKLLFHPCGKLTLNLHSPRVQAKIKEHMRLLAKLSA